jgi:aminopeptidase
MKQAMLKKYGDLAAKVGANVQPNQAVIVQGPVEAAPLIREVVRAAYDAGAKEVQVFYREDVVSREHLLRQDVETLETIPDWMVASRMYYVEKGACFISVIAPDPDSLTGVDPEKIKRQSRAMQAKTKALSDYLMANHGQWTIVAMPSDAWAKKVFPQLKLEEAKNELWHQIFKTVRIEEHNDPVQAWDEHNQRLQRRCSTLNEMNLKALHYTNALGTDFTIELVEKHRWAGGSEHTTKGVVFNPNMPTEEVFTMPYKYGANGKVVATKPLNYNGKLIEGFWLQFEKGKVVDYGAKQEVEMLKMLVEMDEGSAYLGEVALVPYHSPISESGLIFYNTLFDENASCHLALGRAYPMNVQGGTSMTPEQLEQAGANFSLTHVDFMIGSEDLTITGILHYGKEVAIFRQGDFVIE